MKLKQTIQQIPRSKEEIRIEALRDKMTEDPERVQECYLLYTIESQKYFSGFNSHPDVGFVIVFKEGKGIVVTDRRYETQIKQEVDEELFDIYIVQSGGSYMSTLVENFPFDKRSVCLHIEEHHEDHFPAKTYLAIKEKWPNTKIDFPLRPVFDIRSVKELEEIELIKNAVQITEATLEVVLSLVKTKMTEKQIAAEITYRHIRLGANDAFNLIVLAGDHSDSPHGATGERIIKRGDLLQFDIGCKYKGYCSDLSRVFVVGKDPTKRQREIYDKVLSIQETMISLVKPGLNFQDLNKKYADLLRKLGFEPAHGLGHGIGLNIHESPSVGQPSPEYGEYIAEPGNVITVEPGIYISGWGGIRIEDDILVTETGHEVLTSFPKELRIIG